MRLREWEGIPVIEFKPGGITGQRGGRGGGGTEIPHQICIPTVHQCMYSMLGTIVMDKPEGSGFHIFVKLFLFVQYCINFEITCRNNFRYGL